MIIVHISDTHGKHSALTLPKGDVLIHSGDFSHYEIEEETIDFLDWFRKQPFKHRILIAGNHDSTFCERRGNGAYFYNLEGIHYLNNQKLEINGIKFYGSPCTPDVHGMPFTYYKEEAYNTWKNLPNDIEILITHGPIAGILDSGFGCEQLKEKIEELTQLKLHLFGHIHQAKGLLEIDKVTYSNAAQTVHVLRI